MPSTTTQVKKTLAKYADKKQAAMSQRFFKMGKGQYGEGAIFLGVTVPQQRAVAKQFMDLPLAEIQKLLNDKIHTYRSVALIILVNQYRKANQEQKRKIIKAYLQNTSQINNWDLVDMSAYNIIGDFLCNGNNKREILYKLAKSKNIWERRIAIVSTYAFIKNSDLTDTFRIAEMLLDDSHDLIHKAVGWMLREAGNVSQQSEEKFLKKHYKKMPRTMLRYAIERFPEAKRQIYLKK